MVYYNVMTDNKISGDSKVSSVVFRLLVYPTYRGPFNLILIQFCRLFSKSLSVSGQSHNFEFHLVLSISVRHAPNQS